MNLDSLTHTSGEWLRGSGPESDIVVSSRIRLARNLAAFPFTNRASPHQKAEIEGMLRDRIAKLDMDPKLAYVHLPGLSAGLRSISRRPGALAAADPSRLAARGQDPGPRRAQCRLANRTHGA